MLDGKNAAELTNLVGSGNPVLDSSRSKGALIQAYLDKTRFANPGPGQIGTLGRNALEGPGTSNVDVSLAKALPIKYLGEAGRAELRLEAFNLFNHRNNGTPGVFWTAFGFAGTNCIDCGDSGVIRALGAPMRQLQVGLTVTF